MKVLMLNPPFLPRYSRASRSPAVTKGGTIYYPLRLAYATGAVEKAGLDVKLVDAPADNLNKDDVVKLAKEYSPGLIVIETSTPSIHNDVKVAEDLKDATGAFILVVGTHPSVLPEQTLKMSSKIDAVGRKEYDNIAKEIALALRDKKPVEKIKGISYVKGGKTVHNPDMPYMESLEDLPFVTEVYKKYLNIRNYFFAAAEYPMVMIFSGRGCPNMCFFCLYPQTFGGRKYRLRSAENVVEEFEYILKNMPEVKEIGIEDDTFSADLGRVHKICNMLIEKGIHKKIKWWANTRVNLDLESMELMKKAGCRLIIPGYESGVQEILNNIKKGATVKQAEEFAKNARKAGLLVHGCFIFGLPGETRETIRQTINFAKRLNPDTVQFFPLMVYPGTEAYEWAKKHNFLLTEDYSKWLTPEGQHRTVISLPGLTPEDLVNACNQARKEFYLRPRYILYKIKQSILHPQEAKRNLKAAKSFLRYLFR